MPTTRRRRTPGAVASLLVLASPDRGAVGNVHLLGVETYIGREPAEPELVWIGDPAMAIRHARVKRVDDRFTLEDLGSGSFVEGERVVTRELRFGEVLRCGDTLFLFQRLDLDAIRWTHSRFSGLVGRSPGLVRALRTLADLAADDRGVVLQGEPGVGRERLAWELHRLAGRSGPFISYHCDAVPPGDHRSLARDALPSTAKGGTLFLGNAERLPSGVLAGLIRVTRPRGGRWPRLVLSGPEGFVPRAGRWAEVPLPPLRLRRDDVLPLAMLFLGPGIRVHPDLQEAMLLCPWPGNCDRLKATCDWLRSVGGETLGRELLPLVASVAPSPGLAALASRLPDLLPPPPPPGEAATEDELASLLSALDSVKRVAAYLGRDRAQVYRWLRRYGLSLPRGREPGTRQGGSIP